jgi:thiamine pyrophosphate-dependent acetolactate synthase large subunit-like protein
MATVGMKVYQAIAKVLAENGIDTLFGLIGDGNLYMVDSFIRDQGGLFIAAAHEVGATLMALGHATATGQVGVATVTHGAAVSNTVTALIEGVKSATPLVLLCGDTPVDNRDHLQNIPQRELIVATGAGFEQLRSAATLSRDIATAFRRALAERRPIALNMPIEMQWSDVEYVACPFQLWDDRVPAPAGDDLDNAIGIIAAAKRPVVLAGRGAIRAEARAALVRLADRLEAPLATTLRAKDLFRDEPFNLGVSGTVSNDIAVEALLESDCIIAFGASLNFHTTSHGAYLRGKRVVQVNTALADLGRYARPDIGLVGDAATVADTIVHWLDEAEIPPSGYRSDALADKLAAPLPPPTPDEGRGVVNVATALRHLNDVVPRDRILVTDTGRFIRQAWTYIDVEDASRFIHTSHFASIGLGLSEAIGAAAAGKGPVLLVTGDGGFMLGGLAEFNTAVRHGSDLIVAICNDGGYGAEHIQFRNKDMDPSLSLLGWPDFAPVAIALGGEGVTVRSDADLALATEAIRNRRGPLLIDIKLDPDQVPGIY